MKYTKQQRADIAQALKAAKPFLWDGIGRVEPGHKQYICDALSHAYWSGEANRADPYTARRMICMRIDGCFTFERWLEKQGIPRSKLIKSSVQAHSHAWLDQLIEEFSK